REVSMFPSVRRSLTNRSRPQSPRARPRRFRPLLEALEDRLSPAVFTVITAADDGNNTTLIPGSLREAIIKANANPGQDLIKFDDAGAVVTVSPVIALPTITDSVVIDGSGPFDSKRALFGDSAPAGTNGLTITAADCVVTNLHITRFFTGSGILITGPGATND